MAQNIYDDPKFFAAYSQLNRQVDGLAGAAEWPALKGLLPDVTGSDVLDLGCGFGWFSRWAVEQGAASVLGVDLSSNMLDRAQADTSTNAIEYRQADLDTIELSEGYFDLVFSSLTFHYVLDMQRLFSQVERTLRPDGAFVYSVEHPIYSAASKQQITELDDGRRVWPVEDYLVEGQRLNNWLGDGVQKQHRMIASYVNAMINTGLVIEELIEWGSTDGDERHRPWFLLVKAHKP